MKFFSFSVLLLLFSAVFFGTARAQSFYGTTDLKTFRDGRDREFRSKDESPLREADFASFTGLNYFPVSEKYKVTARFTQTPDEKYFQMPTSSGKTTKYKKFGVLSFEIDGKTYSLNAYQWELPQIDEKYAKYKEFLLIPFRDQTNGAETYGAGRYVYIKIPNDKETILDFNLAFNPSCAYGNDKYSCPIPPKENNLPIKIAAGEKSYLSAENKIQK
jgi:hypothetical protein